MRLEIDPPLEEALLEALEPAVLQALTEREEPHPAQASRWWRAAQQESVEQESVERESVENEPRRYAPSPRRTRGARRA